MIVVNAYKLIMNILFILIDDKLDAHYIITENANNKEG